jgi:hypothetical protein
LSRLPPWTDYTAVDGQGLNFFRLSLLLLLVFPLHPTFTDAAELYTGTGYTTELPLYVPGELLVKFHKDKRTAALQRYRQRMGVGFLRRFRSIDVDHLRLGQGLTVEQALAVLRSDPAVIYAEPNYYCSATGELPDNGLDDDGNGYIDDVRGGDFVNEDNAPLGSKL